MGALVATAALHGLVYFSVLHGLGCVERIQPLPSTRLANTSITRILYICPVFPTPAGDIAKVRLPVGTKKLDLRGCCWDMTGKSVDG